MRKTKEKPGDVFNHPKTTLAVALFAGACAFIGVENFFENVIGLF
jgi:hypothetical protein